MDNRHPVAPQTCVLKMHTKCEKSLRKMKRGLEKLHGVHSIKIDSNEGRVTVTSTSDPQLFIEMLTRAAKQSNLIWEYESSPPLNNHHGGGGNSSHQPPRHHHHHHHHSNHYKFNQNPEIAQELQELAKNRTVKTLEVTHSKNIKMTFMDNDEINSNQDHVVKTDMDSEKESMSNLYSKSPTPTPQTTPQPPPSRRPPPTPQPPPSRPPPPPPTTMQPRAPPPTTANQFGNETAKDSGIGSSSSIKEPIKPPSVTPKMESPSSTDITCGDENCIIM